ncbi:hypothetical protein [Larkinella soli]|uniref:hypothetical protein n=1 Tax=Larkinella soli TaxID=1770527 RepID=UPI000FFC86F5|nr:hypothetical protein [Larkinella soli]
MAGALLVAGFLLGQNPVCAQTEGHYTRIDSTTNGFWKLRTNYATRSTVIQFFNAQGEPLYQETLAGRYVKLTKRNIRLFDGMLKQLMQSSLLADQLKTHELLASERATFLPTTSRERPETEERPVVVEPNGTLTAYPVVSPTGRLQVGFNNPAQEKITIGLATELSYYVYKEATTLETYNRVLNLSKLAGGNYRLEIGNSRRRLTYRLTIDNDRRTYLLRPVR